MKKKECVFIEEYSVSVVMNENNCTILYIESLHITEYLTQCNATMWFWSTSDYDTYINLCYSW
jgi:hypothetical protein